MDQDLNVTRISIDPEALRAAGRHIYMCRHESGKDRSLEEITASHDLDLMFQREYGVRWLSYFSNRDARSTFCLAEASSAEAVRACHARAHGSMPAYPVVEVEWQTVRTFLGEIGNPGQSQDWDSNPFRTLMLAEVANAPALSLKLGDPAAHSAIQTALSAAAQTVTRFHGTTVNHGGASILASFTSAARAVNCSLGIQVETASLRTRPEETVSLRIALNAGEPISEGRELFGAAIDVCREICSRTLPGAILVSGVVHDLCAGKGHVFVPAGTLQFQDTETTHLYAVETAEGATVIAPVTAFPDGLTFREVDVLRLIAAGHSNQQISDALFISLNTVARHVAHILNKTGCANRTHAAAYAYRERLL